MTWFRLDANPDIELEFQVEGVSVVMPNALPLVVLTEESATQLCLELAYQLKLARGRRADDRALRPRPPWEPPHDVLDMS